MKVAALFMIMFPATLLNATGNKTEILKTASHLPGLSIAITHKVSVTGTKSDPVLFIHGSSFPSALAFDFKMDNYSWMDHLSNNGYDVYALDFLGYGHSDRYLEMQAKVVTGKPVGRALDIYKDIDSAVDLIIRKTGKTRVHIIAHSWGGSVAALYATKFPQKVARLVLLAPITERQDTTALQQIEGAYEAMTPAQRIAGMKDLTPEGKACPLTKEVLESWGSQWLQSDPLAVAFHSDSVCFPSGPVQDIEDMLHGRSYYNPAAIKAPTLIIRGEWDDYPDNKDARQLLHALKNAPERKYVVIAAGTHVLHLENNRLLLYREVLQFLR
jgi:pimeloyl-ACP methyl ester carboxylesterase